MSCYHPLKGLVLGTRPDGKKIIKIIKSEKLDYINKNDYADVIEIPCGHCVGCRLDYSREWANRCMLELEEHDQACFITLTYDDEHLPPGYPVHTLCKKDLQKFFKRLRKHFPDNKIRYFACGEYGSQTFRPHYHAIVYGIDFSEDREVIKKDSEFTYYISHTLEKIWSDPDDHKPYGYHLIASVNWNTAAYCARYAVKKLGRDYKDFYSENGIEPEFATMSRKPGIGRNYYDKHKDKIYDSDEIFLTLRDTGKRIQPPKYFDRLLEVDDPLHLEEIKLIRSDRVESRNQLISSSTDKSYLDYKRVQEDNKLDKLKSLSRKEI